MAGKELTQDELIEAAKKYLKRTYGEDTLSMEVVSNTVKNGEGVLSVNCTVRAAGVSSHWSKKFYFRAGKIYSMDARPR
jgi:hypothetical protein